MRVSDDVLNVLDRAVFDGAELVITEQLPRPMYLAVNKVLEAAGGKWNRKAKAHLFDGDAREIIEAVILTGEVVDAKREFDQFFTPQSLAYRMVAIAKLSAGDLVLEPSGGHGSIAEVVRAHKAAVRIAELLPQNVRVLREKGFADFEIMEGDFLSITTSPFDVVLMNPPFSKRQDIHHVRHALNFLVPGGRLVAVMSSGVLFREDKLTREFRAEIERRGGRFEPLPDGSFRESGTMVRTCLCIVGC